jgi:DNA-binding NarL/FixJ family response regulator
MSEPRNEHTKRVLVFCNGCTDALCDALPDASFEVVACATAERMLEEAPQRSPDLILCRQGPHSTADPATLRLLRRLAPATPLVVLSESTSIEGLRAAQEFRPVFFVLEPSDPAELCEIVRAILASSRAGRGKPTDAIFWGRALK